MSEFRFSPPGGWASLVSRAASRIALGSMAEGVVAGGLRSRTPQVYEQALADVGTVVHMDAITQAGPLAVEFLVDHRPEPGGPAAYV